MQLHGIWHLERAAVRLKSRPWSFVPDQGPVLPKIRWTLPNRDTISTLFLSSRCETDRDLDFQNVLARKSFSGEQPFAPTKEFQNRLTVSARRERCSFLPPANQHHFLFLRYFVIATILCERSSIRLINNEKSCSVKYPISLAM